MKYYMEVPFGGRGDKSETKRTNDDDLMRIHGVTFMRISGRQFDRLTKCFREQAWPYQVLGLCDTSEEPQAEVLATVVMAPDASFPCKLYIPNRE